MFFSVVYYAKVEIFCHIGKSKGGSHTASPGIDVRLALCLVESEKGFHHLPVIAGKYFHDIDAFGKT